MLEKKRSMMGCQQHYEASNNSMHLSEHLSTCGEGSLAVLTHIILTNSQRLVLLLYPFCRSGDQAQLVK